MGPTLLSPRAYEGDSSPRWACGVRRERGVAFPDRGVLAQLESHLDQHDLIHSHYWLSGQVGLQLKRSHGIRWCTPCTPWLV